MLNKTDSRHYNRQDKRDLALHMALWCQWKDRLAIHSEYGKTVTGTVIDIDIERPTSKILRAIITFDDGTKVVSLIINRKIQFLTYA